MGLDDGLNTALCLEFAINAIDMRFDGTEGDDQVPGDFLIRVACNDLAQHIPFPLA